MKIALSQLNVKAGQVATNLAHMKAQIKKYDEKDYDFIVFPELCVGGYMVGDLFFDPDFINILEEASINLITFVSDLRINVIFGNVCRTGYGLRGEKDENGKGALMNSAFIISPSNIKGDPAFVGMQGKQLLPNYRVFDDKRYFTSDDTSTPFTIETRHGDAVKIGLEICEDMWDDSYKKKPTKSLIEQGAELIFNISASPFTKGKSGARDAVIIGHLPLNWDGFFFYTNCTGAQNNGKNIVTFDGDSAIFSKDGRLDRAYQGQEVLEFDTEKTNKFAGVPDGMLTTSSKYFHIFHAIVQGIRHMDDIMGNNRFPYIVGVSGGIDSAVVLSLLALAVGPGRILAYNLPTKYNSKQTKGFAKSLCDHLGITLKTLPIGALAGEQLKFFKKHKIHPKPLNIENIQAKIRGTTVLSNIAGIEDGVMTNNGNKVEIALGYATLYGDVNGSIAPIGDLTKVEVWGLANWLNDYFESNWDGNRPIPKELIWNPADPLDTDVFLPSAELKENQKDPMKWGYHDALLSYVMKYNRGSVNELADLVISGNFIEFYGRLSAATEGDLTPKQIEITAPKGMQNILNDLRWFFNLFYRSTFKRIQSPPIILISRTSFGFDYRESQLGRPDYILQSEKYLG